MKKSTKSGSLRKVFSDCGKREAHVGMDVHKRSVSIALWIKDGIARQWVMPYDCSIIVKMFLPYKDKICRAVYESGPTGFPLARALRRAGINTEVIPSSKISRPAGRESKSDSIDARKLAERSAKNDLKFVNIPTETEEEDRQILRTREQFVRKSRTVKNQIKGFLLAHGIKEPHGLRQWTCFSLSSLRNMALCPQLRFCLDMMLDELEHQKEQIGRINEKLAELAKEERYSENYSILRTHPGVGPITSMTFLLEVYRGGGRFENERKLASYLGLAPMIEQTGETRRDCGILRTGRGSVRGVLVEAAWRWIANDKRAMAVYRRLVSRTGSGKKAIVGMARRLAINLWMMLEKGEVYRKSA
jgi:transposase